MTRLFLKPAPDGVGQAAATRAEPISGSGVGTRHPARLDGGAPGSLVRARRQPSQRITYAPTPQRLQEVERARSRQLQHELHERQRAGVGALTASLLAAPDNRFTAPEAAAVATVGAVTVDDLTSGRITSKVVTDTDGKVLSTLTASGWTDRWGGIVAAVEAVPVGVSDHRCAGASTGNRIVRFSTRPDYARCSACSGGTFRSEPW